MIPQHPKHQTTKLISSIRLMLLLLYSIAVGVSAILSTPDHCSIRGREVTVDNEATVAFDDSFFLHIPIKTEAASLWTSYRLSFTFDAFAEDLIEGFARLSFAEDGKGSIHERNFLGSGVFLVYGPELLGTAQYSCLEITVKNQTVATVTVSLAASTMSWTGPLIFFLSITAAAAAVVVWSSRVYTQEGGRQPLSALVPSWKMVKAVAFVSLIEIFGSLPGMYHSIHTYRDQFLEGDQDACNFDVRSFFVYGNLPVINTMISHYAYFATAAVTYCVVQWKACTCRCFCGTENECGHWQLGRLIAVAIFYLGLRSMGYHLCPSWPTVPLDYSGIGAVAYLTLSLLNEERRLSHLNITVIYANLVALTHC